MPILPKYTWSETDADMTVVFDGVSLRSGGSSGGLGGGLSLGGAGVGEPLVVSDRVVKLNLPPHFVLLPLHGEVDAARAVASFGVVEEEQEEEGGEGAPPAVAAAATSERGDQKPPARRLSRRPVLTLRLPKRHPGIAWSRLLAEDAASPEAAARCARSFERLRERQQAAAEARAARRRQAEAQAADRALLVEERRREASESARAAALGQACAAVAEWGASLALGASANGQGGGDGSGGGGSKKVEQGGDDAGGTQDQGKEEDDDGESDYDEQLEGASREVEEDNAPQALPTAAASSPASAGADSDSPWYHGRCRWRASKAEEDEEEEEKEERTGAAAGVAAPRPPPPPLPPRGPLAMPADAPPVRSMAAAGGGGAVFRVAFTETASGTMPLREGREARLVAALEQRMRRQKQQQQQEKDKEEATAALGAPPPAPPPPLEERSPAFLKDKGDALFRRGDCNGAVHAYTLALDLLLGGSGGCEEEGEGGGGSEDSQAGLAAALLSNRAAALLRLAQQAGDHDLALRCVADCDAALAGGGLEDAAFRARALARRGAALALLPEQRAAAADDCAEASRLFARAGDAGRAASLEAEAHRLRMLMATQE
jgi:hypothetical protein